MRSRRRRRAIATDTLHRPDKLNAPTRPKWQRLGQLMRDLQADDIAEFAAERSNFDQGKAYGELLHGALGAIADRRHPTVVLIGGICVGGDPEIAALCDLRICGQGSRFGVSINTLGLVMAHAEVAALVQLAGRAVALEMLLEGRVFDAAGIAAGPIRDIAALARDPQTLARETVVEPDHPVAGRRRALGLPLTFSATPGGVRRPASTFGQHTLEVLQQHGFGRPEIDALVAEGAVQLGR